MNLRFEFAIDRAADEDATTVASLDSSHDPIRLDHYVSHQGILSSDATVVASSSAACSSSDMYSSLFAPSASGSYSNKTCVAMFDTSEKQRGPSWCDRILFRSLQDKLRHEKLDQPLWKAAPFLC
jgi:hypothetical protein